jgi:hypothetical protein
VELVQCFRSVAAQERSGNLEVMTIWGVVRWFGHNRLSRAEYGQSHRIGISVPGDRVAAFASTLRAQETLMALRFLGSDPDSPQGGSPSLWDDGDSYVIQGWQVTDTATLGELLRSAGQERIPANETLIRFPKRLMHMFPELSSGR